MSRVVSSGSEDEIKSKSAALSVPVTVRVVIVLSEIFSERLPAVFSTVRADAAHVPISEKANINKGNFIAVYSIPN